jgi:hypothetical protein
MPLEVMARWLAPNLPDVRQSVPASPDVAVDDDRSTVR